MQKNTFNLAKGIYWVGVNDPTLRVFDITMYTEFGSTYNAYLVIGSEKSAIIDTAKENYSIDFIAKVESLIDISKVDYLILNHTEPDHSGSVIKILEKNPTITIIASAPGLSNLKEIVNVPFESIRAKDDLKISLGDKTLSFMIQPNLHWPDTMFTYAEEDEVLFTCDYFGAHYSFEGVLSKYMKDREEYVASMKYYFECIMEPFKPDVLRALHLIESLKVKLVATSHGAVVDETFLDHAKELYRRWGQIESKNQVPLVVIPFTSVYGYTRKMIPSIEEGIKKAFDGIVKVEVYDLVDTPVSDVVARIRKADGFLIGSTTILGDAVKPVWDVLTLLNPQVEGGKFASAFGSYGWSGEAVKFMMERLKQLKMKTVEGLRIRFNPSESQLQDCVNFGFEFGKAIRSSRE